MVGCPFRLQHWWTCARGSWSVPKNSRSFWATRKSPVSQGYNWVTTRGESLEGQVFDYLSPEMLGRVRNIAAFSGRAPNWTMDL